MMRVGFALAFKNRNWIGGINYYVNLMHALKMMPNCQIEPVIITMPDAQSEFLSSLPSMEVLRTQLVDESLRLRYLRKGPRRLIGRDPLMEIFLHKHKIELYSHSGELGRHSSVPTLCWIPDFQHRRMPGFFSPEECAARDAGYGRYCNDATGILLSSEDARKDLGVFAPKALEKSSVLHFVAGLKQGNVESTVRIEALRRKYRFGQVYFFLPNQFWAHKNHRIVVDALAILKAQGKEALVLCTGQTADRRQPDHFETLMGEVRNKGLEDAFRILGLVPYEDLKGLMQNSLAVINPSFFEGWSTTVEESKSTGKRIILSDIPVHREQAPERCIFFDPNNAERLADAMTFAIETYSIEEERAAKEIASASLPERINIFAGEFENIALATVGRSRGRPR